MAVTSLYRRGANVINPFLNTTGQPPLEQSYLETQLPGELCSCSLRKDCLQSRLRTSIMHSLRHPFHGDSIKEDSSDAQSVSPMTGVSTFIIDIAFELTSIYYFE